MPVRRTYAEVLKEFVSRDYILIDTVYKNNKQKLRYKCKSHSDIEQEIRFNDLTTGHGCKLCGEERKIENLKKMAFEQRISDDNVAAEFNNRGYKLISKYENAHQHLIYQCPEHPERELKIRFSDLKAGNGCKYCAIEDQRLGIETARRIFSEHGYDLIEQTYTNASTPMRYTCPKHPDKETRISVGDLKGGHGCGYCAIEKSRGKLSVHYNHELNDEERAKDRRYDAEIHSWRKAVFDRDSYTCTICGNGISGNLNAHHKDGFNWCIDRRYAVDNGVTLCKGCHKEFHTEYGYGDNTESQYADWLKTKDASE